MWKRRERSLVRLKRTRTSMNLKKRPGTFWNPTIKYEMLVKMMGGKRRRGTLSKKIFEMKKGNGP